MACEASDTAKDIVGGSLRSVNDAVRDPSAAVPLPPFRPSFTWTCIFKEQYPTRADEYGPLVLEVVNPPVVVRHVEVNEGTAPTRSKSSVSTVGGR